MIVTQKEVIISTPHIDADQATPLDTAESWVRQQYITQSIVNPLTQRARSRNVLGYSQEGREPSYPFHLRDPAGEHDHVKTVPVIGLQPTSRMPFSLLHREQGQRLSKTWKSFTQSWKKQVIVAISELAIAELIPSNIHSGQERAKSIRRLLVIYLLFLQSHVVGEGN